MKYLQITQTGDGLISKCVNNATYFQINVKLLELR